MGKILFFDIDGTLVDLNGLIPESTREALHLAKENGHRCFLCTGRTASMIPAQVMDLGWDGVVAGAGTYLEYRGEVLYYRELTMEEIEKSLKWLVAGRFGFLYEGRYCVHVMPWEHYYDAEMYRKHVNRIGAPYEVIDVDHPEKILTSKFTATIKAESWDYCQQMIAALADFLHPIIHQAPAVKGSSASLSEGLVEFVPVGCDKGTGIQMVLDMLGIPLSDAYGFGDSNNDLEMLELLEHSICMGNGSARAMEASEYVTTDINADGIWNAMKHYGLI